MTPEKKFPKVERTCAMMRSAVWHPNLPQHPLYARAQATGGEKKARDVDFAQREARACGSSVGNLLRRTPYGLLPGELRPSFPINIRQSLRKTRDGGGPLLRRQAHEVEGDHIQTPRHHLRGAERLEPATRPFRKNRLERAQVLGNLPCKSRRVVQRVRERSAHHAVAV